MQANKTAISELLIVYFNTIDDKCLNMDIVKRIFITDAKIKRPKGSETAGHQNIPEVNNNRSFARFSATQHKGKSN